MKFKYWDCDLVLENYAENNNTAIRLIDKRDKSPVAMATVNLSVKLPKDQAYIKDYSENEGMLVAFQKAGFVKDIIGYRDSGFVTIPLCKLDLDKIKEVCINV